MAAHIRKRSQSLVEEDGALLSERVRQRSESNDRLVAVAHAANLAINTALLVAKLGVFLTSGSMAVLASLLDSAVDLVAQGVLYAASHLARSSPSAGKGQYAPLGVFTCAILMGLAAAQVIWISLGRVGQMLAGKAVPLEWTATDSHLMMATVFARLVVAIGCTWVAERTRESTIAALSQDSINDVMSNAAALFAAWATQLGPVFAFTDPVGAILISAFIIRSWAETGFEQVELITGREPDEESLALLSAAATRLSMREAELGYVSAFHIGPKLSVDVTLLMDDETTLLRAHSVSKAVTRRLQNLENVQRCVVHVRPRSDAGTPANAWRSPQAGAPAGAPGGGGLVALESGDAGRAAAGAEDASAQPAAEPHGKAEAEAGPPEPAAPPASAPAGPPSVLQGGRAGSQGAPLRSQTDGAVML